MGGDFEWGVVEGMLDDAGTSVKMRKATNKCQHQQKFRLDIQHLPILISLFMSKI
jgi:hypothetical protein